MEKFRSMPLNIITKLKTNIFLTLSFAKDYLGKTIIELNPVKHHKLEINYEKKFKGNGPKVLDSSASSSY